MFFEIKSVKQFILSQIFKDEKGDTIDYWQFFDLCIGDARKPYFFNMESSFYANKNDYPDVPVKELQTGRWYSQGFCQLSSILVRIRIENIDQICRGEFLLQLSCLCSVLILHENRVIRKILISTR